jgi:hypothetical protein
MNMEASMVGSSPRGQLEKESVFGHSEYALVSEYLPLKCARSAKDMGMARALFARFGARERGERKR